MRSGNWGTDSRGSVDLRQRGGIGQHRAEPGQTITAKERFVEVVNVRRQIPNNPIDERSRALLPEWSNSHQLRHMTSKIFVAVSIILGAAAPEPNPQPPLATRYRATGGWG